MAARQMKWDWAPKDPDHRSSNSPVSEDDYLPGVAVGAGWRPCLEAFFSTPTGQHLKDFLASEVRSGQVLFPPPEQVYRALEVCDLSDVRVVILGQDPYHGRGQAHGLAFSVPDSLKLPPSLRNIYKELHEDVGVSRIAGDLSDWARQGVLLLNATLTVRESEAGSHSKQGWEVLTDQLIQEVNQRAAPSVFILWGKDAIAKSRWIDPQRHAILTSPHPSPLSAYRGFFGSRPFSQANQFLRDNGRAAVNW